MVDTSYFKLYLFVLNPPLYYFFKLIRAHKTANKQYILTTEQGQQTNKQKNVKQFFFLQTQPRNKS